MRYLPSMVSKVLEDGYSITETHRVVKGPVAVEMRDGVIRYFANGHECSALDAEDFLDDFYN